MARFYAALVALALEAVHRVARMVYRDVKPENVLLHGRGPTLGAHFAAST